MKFKKKDNARLYCDGASRGNPGPAAVGAVLFPAVRGGASPSLEYSKAIGKATNNVAEYSALILGLEKSLENNIKNLEILLDSELVVRQLSGAYRVKKPDIRLLHTKAKQLLGQLDSYYISHIPREKNTRADSLANQALDKL